MVEVVSAEATGFASACTILLAANLSQKGTSLLKKLARTVRWPKTSLVPRVPIEHPRLKLLADRHTASEQPEDGSFPTGSLVFETTWRTRFRLNPYSHLRRP